MAAAAEKSFAERRKESHEARLRVRAKGDEHRRRLADTKKAFSQKKRAKKEA